jgi:hypothetical protein
MVSVSKPRAPIRERDREDWMLNIQEMAKYVATFGKFTLGCCIPEREGYAKATAEQRLRAAVTEPVGLPSFLGRTLEVEQVWLCAPIRRCGPLLQHYLEARKVRNTDQCRALEALIIVPKWKMKRWWALTKGMQVVHEYPKGTTGLFQAPPTTPGQPWTDMGPLKRPVVVLWDSPIRYRPKGSGRSYGPTFEPLLPNPL